LIASRVKVCCEKPVGRVAKRLELNTGQLITDSVKTARTGPTILVIRKLGIRSAVNTTAIV
jgi:hypothetical protein